MVLNRKVVLTSIAALWLQMSIVPFLAFQGVMPDVCLVLAAFYAFEIDHRHIIFYAFLLGFLRDLLTSGFFGLETASYVFGGLVLHQMAAQLDRHDERVQWAGAFFSSAVTLVMFVIFLAMAEENYRVSHLMWLKSFLIAVYTTLAAVVLSPLLRFVFQLKPLVKQYELF